MDYLLELPSHSLHYIVQITHNLLIAHMCDTHITVGCAKENNTCGIKPLMYTRVKLMHHTHALIHTKCLPCQIFLLPKFLFIRQEMQVSSEVSLVPFTAQCVDNFGWHALKSLYYTYLLNVSEAAPNMATLFTLASTRKCKTTGTQHV